MTNTYQWIGTIKAEGVVYNAMGTGKSAPIAPEDIAAVAVKALTVPSLSDEVFELTGSQLLSVPEQVTILADVLGKPIRCVDVPMETAVQGLIRAGIPAQIAAAVGQSFEAIRDGRARALNNTVERVTGNQPKTFEAWAREHASRFT
jgi:(4-alkanoyl-5-oxo-2,5-dihydrofuran-3-yl)methyl phosphate reductase